MYTDSSGYSLFFKFIEAYSAKGFQRIESDNRLMLDLEELMEKNRQFLYIADAIQMKILYTSKRSAEMIGIEPEDLNFYHFMEATHPDDLHRLSIGRAKLLKNAQDLFIAEGGTSYISTNFKIRNAAGRFGEFLTQNYLFYTATPYRTVFLLKIHTDIGWCKKIKHGFHYYLGTDLSYFRYPDDEMLNMGNVFTKREFEIIRFIALGLSSEQIAEKLYLSHYTIETHRGNILKKAGKAHITDLIFELQEKGLL